MANKYHSHKVRNEYGTFDSEKEYRRFLVLIKQRNDGEITNLQRQVEFELIPKQVDENGKSLERKMSYIADFVYFRDGKMVVEDTKGLRTDVYIVKRKMMLYKYGIRVLET